MDDLKRHGLMGADLRTLSFNGGIPGRQRQSRWRPQTVLQVDEL